MVDLRLYDMGRGWFVSNLLLCSIIDVRWWIDIMLILISTFVILV